MHMSGLLVHRIDHDGVLASAVCVEGPPESAEALTVRISKVLVSLCIFKHLPAHEFLIVFDCDHAHEFFSFAFKFKRLNDLDISLCLECQVREMMLVFQLERTKLDLVSILVTI